MYPKRYLLAFLITIPLIGIAFIAGFIARDQAPPSGNRYTVLNQAYEILSNNALEEIPEDPILEYGMIRGMLQASGDPYALFLEPATHELETDNLEGNFGGIGVELVQGENGEVFLYPFPDSPAAQAGVLAGDRLLAVDELSITPEMPFETIQAAIRGDINQKVTLRVSRENEPAPLEFQVSRKEMPLPSVTWRLYPGTESIGIIKINIIASSTSGEILHAVQELTSQGADRFILDLRNNGGGLLTESIEVARLFLSSGEILKQEYRGKPVDTYSVEKSGPLASTPTVVLVNGNTASAAEIIAGALKAHKRASIIGTPTHGKDTIQLIFNLEDGSSMHITAARWWIPGLDPPIGGHGVQPDLLVPDEGSISDPALRNAAELLLNSP